MQQLGAHTFGLMWQMPAAAAVEALADRGFRHVQLIVSAPHLSPWAELAGPVAAIKSSLRHSGSQVLALDLPSTECNLASANPEVVAFAVATMSRLLDIAADLEAPWLTIISGRTHTLLPPPDDRLLQAYRGAVETLLRRAERRGVRLLLENSPVGLLATASQIEAFLTAGGYDQIDVLYDVTNAAAAGDVPEVGLKQLGPRVKLVHLSDAPVGLWRHDRIGTGDIDFAAFRRALEALRHRPALVAEAVGAETISDLVASRDQLCAWGWPIAR